MKHILPLLKDVGLLIILGLFLAGSIWGVRLPYRYPFVSTGDYQLEAFPVGLAVYQYNRTSPFYRIDPAYEYVLEDEEKFERIRTTVNSFFRSTISPHTSVLSDGWVEVEALSVVFNASDVVLVDGQTTTVTNPLIPGRLIIKTLGNNKLLIKGER